LETTAISARNEGYQGVLLIIDELGKLFEYAARYPQRGDVYVLQEIGEYVARSKASPHWSWDFSTNRSRNTDTF
jgi:hypothetical protein